MDNYKNLQQRTIEVSGVNPLGVFGANNTKLNHIKSYFPKLQIRTRGTTLTLIGDDDVMDEFERKFELMIQHFQKYNALTENNIDNLMLENGEDLLSNGYESQVLVHGNSGIKITARTLNQRKLVKAVFNNDMVFAIGPAGTGKTYTAVALAVRALKAKEVKRIILTRPAVEAGENLGFLPGDLKEKLDPYMMPLYDALHDMIPEEKLANMIELSTIEIAPLAFMRGRTLDNAFVILDEAQNATMMQLKMFLTRMGTTAKFVITGDLSQIDLPYKQQSGLAHTINLLEHIDGIEVVRLQQSDIIRHVLVTKIVEAFEKKEVSPKE